LHDSATDGTQPEFEKFARWCAGALELENGEPLILEPFQRLMLHDYFAGVRETLILLSKKNGKTTLLAALALYHLITTRDAECIIAAASRDQASILYEQAAGFVDRSDGLQDRVVVKGGYRHIRSKKNRGRIRVLAAGVDTADGVIPTLALVDELHRHKSADLYGVFRDGLPSRDGQMITISTAGDNELSPLGLIRTAARKLPIQRRDGKYLYAASPDGGFALHEWALDHEDDLDDLELVKQVNPLSTHTLDELRERHDSPSTMPWQWARLTCGVWAAGEDWWLVPDDWHAAAVDEQIRPGERITLGFDGSRFSDATALVACRLEDGLLQPLGVWEHPGGRGNVEWEVPAGEVDAAIAEAMETYKVVRGYFDPPLWQTEIDKWAREFGEKAVMRYYTNRTRFMGAVERFRTDLAAGKQKHVGDERLTRHAISAQIRQSRGGYLLMKGAREKIDAAIAAVLAYEARSDQLAGAEKERSKVPVSF
jgi:phage terminase large subunit-like protein